MDTDYIKEFDIWNERKKLLDTRVAPRRFYAGDIWWCALGINIGSEQDGKNESFERPVLIIRKITNDMLIVAPITTSIKKYDYTINITFGGIKSQILLSQIRTVSNKRLLRKISVAKTQIYLKTIIILMSMFITKGDKSETPQ